MGITFKWSLIVVGVRTKPQSQASSSSEMGVARLMTTTNDIKITTVNTAGPMLNSEVRMSTNNFGEKGQ
jgi:hypothetical protein